MKNLIEEKIESVCFTHYAPVDISQIVFEASLRKSCEVNSCGKYGKSYSCPPHVGEINDCIAKVKNFNKGYIFQYVGELEDSYDFEGMMASQDVFVEKARTLRELINDDNCIFLGAGPCTLCKTCAFALGKPCVFPNKMISSVEAHGIFVNPTLINVGLKYNNGENTVSYVGLVLFK